MSAVDFLYKKTESLYKISENVLMFSGEFAEACLKILSCE